MLTMKLFERRNISCSKLYTHCVRTRVRGYIQQSHGKKRFILNAQNEYKDQT